MKFSRLKIIGFKSFCDATELHMESGLTGVVGPNGCGKSNLVEALRWVMGESSYKAMRASGMDDVIFSGSANRPSRNSAEVTLVLDNKDRSAPASFNNADELEITRKIERESGSSYRINGREARARDVQLLFADASTGSKSPALVRQGQIGELIAAKPVQRRALLEEAAGISGLHSRRHEAELKLRAAEQNLERVDDVTAQVENQLDTLKRQARLATRYRNVSGDIRKSEATLYHIRWVGARFAQKENEAKQSQVIAQLADATSAQLKTEKALEELNQRLEPLRLKQASTAAALQRLKILRDQLEEDVKRANTQKYELENRQTQLKTDAMRESQLTKEADEQIAIYEKETAELQAEAQNEKAANDEAKSVLEQILAKLKIAEQQAQTAADEVSQLRANKEAATHALNEAKKRLQNLAEKAQDVENEINSVEASLNADQAVSEKTKQLEQAQANFAKAEIATNAAEVKTATTQKSLDDLRPLLAKSESNLSSLQSEAATLARVLNVEGGSLWPSIVDSLNVKSGYEIALGAALGEDLEASSDNGAPIYWDKTNEATTDAKLPDIATPISQFISGETLLNRRLEQIGIVSKTDGKRLMPSLKTGQSLVSIEGDLWRWDGFVAKADAPTAAANRLSQRNRLKELDEEVKIAKNEHEKTQAQLQTLADKLQENRQVEQTQREAWRLSQREISSTQTGLDIAQKALSNLTTRQSALNEAKSQLETNIYEAKQQENLAQEILDVQIDETSAQEKAQSLQNQLGELRDKTQSAKIHLNSFKNAANMRSIRLAQIEREISGWQKRNSSAKSQLETLTTREKQIKQQLQTLNATPDGFEKKRQALDEDIEAHEEDNKTAADRLSIAQTQNNDANKNARDAINALSVIREQLARIEERLKSSIVQRQQIEQITQETLSIPASKTAQIAQLKPDAPLPQIEAIEKRVDRLKAERERLGGVNLGAEKEAQEIKEKLETMIADRDDLIAAIAKLRTGISSLNKEGRARLNDAFDKVNSHFKELFTTLFGGGEAELQFIESDDPLQAGLEIIARPPGKKPQILTLLSGGEQALTALSLIFAVFLTNPAPICVLDEVDAPLDDANVERFCNLLDSMNERTKTRFLVVTHNPITMSRTDRLFGVTMAERGVSQLVSVDLNAAKRVAEVN